MVANTGRLMRVAFFSKPVVIDLAGLKIPGGSLPIRSHHSRDPGDGVGHTTSVFVDGGKQLLAEGVISRDTEAAREIVASSKKGFPWQSSVGVLVDKVDDVDSEMTVSVNGRNLRGPMFVVRTSELAEISFVDRGADHRTSASIRAQREEGYMDKETKEPAVEPVVNKQKTGESGESVPTQVQASAVPQLEARQTVVAASTEEEVGRIRTAAANELARIEGIRKVFAGSDSPTGMEEKAVRDGWNAERAELENLRAIRPKVATIITRQDEQVSGEILEAACFQQAKFPEDKLEAMYEEKVLDIAHKRFGRGIGLQELLLQAAWNNGYQGRSFKSDPRAVLRHAFPRELHAAEGLSTIDIGGILSNVANKFLLEGFFMVEQAWRAITGIRAVSDFKTVTSYRLIGKDQYEKVAPGGELKHGTLANESFTNKADTYGLLLGIDRRDIINDDLGAITTVPRKLGRGAGLKINDIFWTVFMNNSSFFASGNSNYFEGATTNLQINSLTTAEQLFMDMKDLDGKPIGIMPKILLVPTALSAIGAQLFRSLELRDTTASTKFPVANPHAGKFPVIVARYLSNSSYTGNSSTAWYLLADPMDLAVIETCFLNGQEAPTIETSDADFNTLGIKMRGFHDFGVAMQDPKGGVKSKGAA